LSENSTLNKQLIDCYYDYKKAQGYSEYEIVQKREALENVLIPYTVVENSAMVKNADLAVVTYCFSGQISPHLLRVNNYQTLGSVFEEAGVRAFFTSL